MAWTVEELSESKPLPLLKLEKDVPVRIRILAPQIAPAILADSIYANGTWDKAKHFPPDDVAAVIGKRPCDCIGIRNACIFHESLLAWDTTYENFINVVVYQGINAKEKTYAESFILGLNMKLSLWKNMGEQLSLLGYEKNQLWAVDWMIIKTGEGQYNTKYNCTAISDVLEAEINLEEFPAQAEYGDNESPMLIDFRKFYPNPLTTPQQQEEWYNNSQAKAALKSASDNVGQHVPNPRVQAIAAPTVALQAPPTLPGIRNVTPVATAVPVKQITMQSGNEPKKRGRPAGSGKNTTIPVAELNPEITKVPAIGQLPAPPAPVKTVSAYETASKVLDPWGVEMLNSEYLQFIVDAEEDQYAGYNLTPEIVTAATLVLAGPPVEPVVVKPILPGLPKLPGQGAVVVAAPVVEHHPITTADVSTVDLHRATLTKLLMSLPVFKNPANIMQFLKLFFPDGTVRTVRQINDVDSLTQIIAFAEQGNDAVAQAIGV
jgi:hypothetical protein